MRKEEMSVMVNEELGHSPKGDSQHTRSIKCDNLRLEYEEIGSNRRMYGTLRRQEVTLLLFFTGALLAATAQFKDSRKLRLWSLSGIKNFPLCFRSLRK